MKNKPVIIKQEYKAHKEIVWRAISDKEEMKKWYFDIPNFKLEVGSKFDFEGGPESKRYVHLCEVLEIIPLQRLKYSWKYKGYSGNSFVTFELSQLGENTNLKLTHEEIGSFPEDNPDLVRDNFVGGWKALIQDLLKEYLERGKSL